MRQPIWLASLTIVAAALCSSATYAGTYQTITIDGSFADWSGVPVVDSDGGDSATVDIGDVQIANDDEHLYIRATYPNNLAQSTYIALDIDSNPATGYDIFGLGLIGSEAGWQNDFAFRQSTGVFNSGGLSGPYFAAAMLCSLHMAIRPVENGQFRSTRCSPPTIHPSSPTACSI